MKCIWRILLGVLTVGISEVLRHKGHDKSLPCPDQPLHHKFVSLGSIPPGEYCFVDGFACRVDEVTDKVKVIRVIDAKELYYPLDAIAFKVF